MSTPKVGDRIRVTRVVEGTVERLESGADHGTRALLRNCPTGTQRMSYGWVHYGDPEETVEILPPEWSVRDTVRATFGDVVMEATLRQHHEGGHCIQIPSGECYPIADADSVERL